MEEYNNDRSPDSFNGTPVGAQSHYRNELLVYTVSYQ